MTAHCARRGRVAVITLDNPPVNGLGYDTRRAFAAHVQAADADPEVAAIVVTGAGRAFSGGADIKEFGSPKAIAEPNLLSLIRLLEHCGKPTVAAIHTVCMGGGLELALGCHYRVADDVSLSGVLDCRIRVKRVEPAFAKALGAWDFRCSADGLEWSGEVAGPDRLRFLGMTSRYVALIADLSFSETEKVGLRETAI